MIELKNVSFSYGELEVLKNFDLKVEKGECVCLTGASGCGKTTVIRLVCGLEKAQVGDVSSPKKLSVVFQEDRLVESQSLIKNVYLPLKKEDYVKADALIKEFGLWEFRNTPVSNLSGGMKRRTAILRAIAFSGDALVLDEAFNGIDLKNKKLIANIIKREFLEKGKCVLMISHIKSNIELLSGRIVKI